jgi:hypothetical protein
MTPVTNITVTNRNPVLQEAPKSHKALVSSYRQVQDGRARYFLTTGFILSYSHRKYQELMSGTDTICQHCNIIIKTYKNIEK